MHASYQRPLTSLTMTIDISRRMEHHIQGMIREHRRDEAEQIQYIALLHFLLHSLAVTRHDAQLRSYFWSPHSSLEKEPHVQTTPLHRAFLKHTAVLRKLRYQTIAVTPSSLPEIRSPSPFLKHVRRYRSGMTIASSQVVRANQSRKEALLRIAIPPAFRLWPSVGRRARTRNTDTWN
ncbi:hypothetical protein BV22DRAFT_421090 [Leucogyrophana mollusca]|uniref:Uncharacterized protein n=1 Tax=Leucogyrophana mollusca TaxID=85980 RepID=A0ACB8BJQ9_9AGAM|nr:hypothetical protein BV22DRAFT_421090 [Leucogyrophana mollusca]